MITRLNAFSFILLILFFLLIVACQPNPHETQETIKNEVAAAVSATESALPTATAYETATMYPTQLPFVATQIPTQLALPTATAYPTATMYPTFTPLPTDTPTAIPPTSPPSPANNSTAPNVQTSPQQKHFALLDQMTILHDMLVEFQGLTGTFYQNENPDCNRLTTIFNTISTLPEMDVTGTDESVQQAYSAYRSAIAHFIQPAAMASDLVALCATQPENIQNITQNNINAISTYAIRTTEMMQNAWYEIGGR